MRNLCLSEKSDFSSLTLVDWELVENGGTYFPSGNNVASWRLSFFATGGVIDLWLSRLARPFRFRAETRYSSLEVVSGGGGGAGASSLIAAGAAFPLQQNGTHRLRRPCVF